MTSVPDSSETESGATTEAEVMAAANLNETGGGGTTTSQVKLRSSQLLDEVEREVAELMKLKARVAAVASSSESESGHQGKAIGAGSGGGAEAASLSSGEAGACGGGAWQTQAQTEPHQAGAAGGSSQPAMASSSPSDNDPLWSMKNLYPESNLPCKTGILIPMYVLDRKTRVLSTAVPAQNEPTAVASVNLMEDVAKHEADRVANPDKCLNKIVYDSVDPPPECGVGNRRRGNKDGNAAPSSTSASNSNSNANAGAGAAASGTTHSSSRVAGSAATSEVPVPNKAQQPVILTTGSGSASETECGPAASSSCYGEGPAGPAASGSASETEGNSETEKSTAGARSDAEDLVGRASQASSTGAAAQPLTGTGPAASSTSSKRPLPPEGTTHEPLSPWYRLKMKDDATSATAMTPEQVQDTTLVFESRFESGNLRRVVQVSSVEYDLVLNPDYNTTSHAQWYYFRVTNMRRGTAYRFNIINLIKPTSLYNEGMRPVIYSMRNAKEKGQGWVRSGFNCAYYQNGISKRRGVYYTLTFEMQFEHDFDEVYVAQCYPYTYTDLQFDLSEIETAAKKSNCFRRRKLCETLAANACDLITITNFDADAKIPLRDRFGVVITARVHPGETSASWVMKGILEFLTSDSPEAVTLRNKFVFKLIPMLNPDGVVVGNYRCSLAGLDLNRRWQDPSRKLSPTIYFTKNLIKRLLEDRDIALFLDIHGHSRKKNIFMYGNIPSCEEEFGVERIFPKLLSQNCDYFSFADCNFKRVKESTARCVVYKEFKILNSFTLEASFCGPSIGGLKGCHFNTRHLEQMGADICKTLLDYENQQKLASLAKELAQGGNLLNCDSDDPGSDDDRAAADVVSATGVAETTTTASVLLNGKVTGVAGHGRSCTAGTVLGDDILGAGGSGGVHLHSSGALEGSNVMSGGSSRGTISGGGDDGAVLGRDDRGMLLVTPKKKKKSRRTSQKSSSKKERAATSSASSATKGGALPSSASKSAG
eukprot:CAMPEP_0179009986 /NCGR_PEP_ID=MMETSP0795-20121207/16561_1 /TAXON_ID=88552 /ORGANISM="Amoebophrya sp., Strain Ameob2" /LENGTH=993 /DNA_ID=CAMNT_0020705213 /DNA_START=120 /DNA_END=3100 /DNA_ORIENTATION=-